jgi:protein-tyrosine phosphatase
MVHVCFVCLGNICRSPLAHGVFEALLIKEGLENKVLVSSAGTGHWHVGSPPDNRMQATARKYGVSMDTRAEQFQASDFSRYDLVLAMDESNLSVLESICPDSGEAEKLRLFRSFDPESNGDLEVPDPYYGGDGGFETVYRIVDRTCPEILEYLKPRLTP